MPAFANRNLAPTLQAAWLAILFWVANTHGFPWFTVFLFCFQLGLMLDGVGAPLLSRIDGRVAAICLSIAIVVLMGAASVSRLGYMTMKKHIFLEGIAAFVIVAYVVSRTGTYFNALLLHPVFRFLGRISYSIYAMHAFVVWAVYNIVVSSLRSSQYGLTISGGSLSAISDNYSIRLHLLAAAISIPASIAVAYVTWRWIENPLHCIGRRLAAALAQRK
jgi:peptidoglycan/LPS O-acetylase OafA/YrhL